MDVERECVAGGRPPSLPTGSAVSTLPVFTPVRGTMSVAGVFLIDSKRFPLPGSVSSFAQVTFSSAAAWIASYSCGATTPRKFALVQHLDARDM